MHTGARLPRVGPDVPLSEALVEMTGKRLGMTAVVDGSERVLGVFTDGDLRRALDLGPEALATPMRRLMTAECVTVREEMLAAECLHLMQTRRINGLLVVDADERLVGAFNTQDLLQAGVL